jgi:hypothetical protein
MFMWSADNNALQEVCDCDRLGDNAYDSAAFRRRLRRHGIKPTTPTYERRKHKQPKRGRPLRKIAIGKGREMLGGNLKREACLTDAAGSNQRKQTAVGIT